MSGPGEAISYVGAEPPEIDARLWATRLRNLLRLNAAFSVATGAIGGVAAGRVAEFVGVDQAWLIRLVGVGLLGFGGVVFTVSGSRTSVLQPLSQIISFNDLGWVAGTVVVIALGWLSTRGAIVMGVIGLVVLGFGVSQMRARNRMIAAAAKARVEMNESPPVEILQISHSSPIAAKDLWPVMSDHELYAKLALNLRAAEGLTPNGPGFERTCTDTLGRTWSETCTLWDAGHRFDVDVDISDYPYPLQLVQGSWRVDPAGFGASSTGMTFAIQPQPGLYGRLFVPTMHLTFPPILKRIARGWQKAASLAALRPVP